MRHHIVEGALAQPLVTGHHKAVVITKDERELSYIIRPLAGSNVGSIPVGVDALFLIDEAERIADVAFDGMEATARAGKLAQKKFHLKNHYLRVEGEVSSLSIAGSLPSERRKGTASGMWRARSCDSVWLE